MILDVRSVEEFTGSRGSPCDPRQGHIPGARHLEVMALLSAGTVEAILELVGETPGTEIVAYCHSGARSGNAVTALQLAGYAARNYRGSWHEWSRDPSLPIVEAG